MNTGKLKKVELIEIINYIVRVVSNEHNQAYQDFTVAMEVEDRDKAAAKIEVTKSIIEKLEIKLDPEGRDERFKRWLE